MKLETKVGVFFITAISILGILIMRTKKIDLFSVHSQHKLIAEFDQVAGLNIKSAIRIAGVKVGEVDNVDLSDNRARVVLSIPKTIVIYRDASVSLNSIGILGEKYLDLDPGHRETGLNENTFVNSKNGASLDTLISAMNDISGDIRSVTNSFKETLGGKIGQQRLDKILDNIYRLTTEVRAIVNDNHKDINNTIANLTQASTNLKSELPKIANEFNNLGKSLNEITTQNKPELRNLLVNMHQLTDNLRNASSNVLSITNKINNGNSTISKLINDDTTIEKINSTADNLNSIFNAFNDTKLALDLSAATWTKRNNTMAGISIGIMPENNYWYNLALNNTPDGRIKVSSTSINTDANNKQTKKTTTKTTTDQTFTISTQFAKRIAEHLVLTAGIVENKGGIGAEFRAINDRLRFGLIGYDFSKHDDKPKPRYRITSSYQFYKECYIQAGIQDMANSKLRTFYFGGGLRWNDDNLKHLIGMKSLK